MLKTIYEFEGVAFPTDFAGGDQIAIQSQDANKVFFEDTRLEGGIMEEGKAYRIVVAMQELPEGIKEG
jgi:hypothetical protein